MTNPFSMPTEKPGRPPANPLDRGMRVLSKAVWWTLTGQIGTRIRERRELRANVPPEAWKLPRLFGLGGTLASRSIPAEADTVLKVPFAYSPQLARPPRIAVVCPAFYAAMAGEIASDLKNIPVPFDCFLSTDTEEKAASIRAAFEGWTRGAMDVRVMPNRGRDIAPKLVGFRDIYADYELVLFLHSKRSTHHSAGGDWRRYLFHHLVGSPQIVASGLAAFEANPRLGILFPQHWKGVSSAIHWAYNFSACLQLARRLGVDIAQDRLLDFPAGSMFWARSAALRALLDLNLSWDDFPEEKGQVDATPAHAVERLMLYACEKAGYTWAKIADPALLKLESHMVTVDSPETLAATLRGGPALLSVSASAGASTLVLSDERLRPLRFVPEDGGRPRLTLIASARPETGLATRRTTLIEIARRAAAERGRSLRIIACDRFDAPWIAALRLYLATLEETARPELVVIPAEWRAWKARVPVQPDEGFFADTWRDARLALALIDDQRRFFGRGGRLVYDIPDLTAAGVVPDIDQQGLADSTLTRGNDIVALFGSTTLAASTAAAGLRFLDQITVRPAWLPAAAPAAAAAAQPAANRLIVPWNPVADPAMARLVVATLDRWQRSDPFTTARWEIVAFGEPGADLTLPSGGRVKNLGRPAADTFAAMAAGARLALVPQTSQVESATALELATFGLTVVSNRHGACDLARLGPAFRLAAAATPEALAATLTAAAGDAGSSGGAERIAIDRAFSTPAQIEQTARWVAAQF
ncbi:rhamnan synthesis F family protein [Pseudoxanthobacter sp.]|uniref:rhamnosyltransferase WsaF family glycosyltransferase n=1 Tax=Pseudoxanthobacter sp. TaxID=1925742 RepID=UPI002FE17A47